MLGLTIWYIGEGETMEEVRTLLHKIINDTNLALSSEEVVTISQQLDKLILKFYLEQNEWGKLKFKVKKKNLNLRVV